ncbi:nicotinamide mononucleotide transporter [Tangfeifania diversioriginum]|uniref:Nicotinamide riboside transporter PnuC n=1 Tax=Tangfeifania diversioriginum TaxID=1168035 RepID=A0A1M6BRR1_9BACT|nr:nicotinamide riboside transporter PnuC [Tangfeifania diversioriginum]SHI51367.1 nicotinamide mononucleotide transporter [Tangfeifania diversioriginum]
MAEVLTTWLWSNKIELIGAILGLLYILFSIRQHILTWATGLLTSALYIVVFFQSGFYADMGLQVYYVFISIYGWYFWLKGEKKAARNSEQQVPVTRIKKWVLVKSAIVTLLIFLFLIFILKRFTDSTVPVMDSLTTALSITATWMLAKKYIEHWIIWIFVDFFSAGLYVYKNLWPTVVLFIVYAVMAIVGYLEWKKDLNKAELTSGLKKA